MSSTTRTLLGFAFAVGDLLLEIGPDGRIGTAMGAAETLLGIKEQALVGQDWRGLVAPLDHALIEAVFACVGPGQRRGPVVARLAGDGAASLWVTRLPGNDDRLSCALSAAPRPALGAGPDGLHDRVGFEAVAKGLTEAARLAGAEMELAMVELAGLEAAGDPDLDRRVAGALRAEAGPMGAATRLTPERFAVLRNRADSAQALAQRLTRIVGKACAASAQSVPVETASPVRLARAMRYALDDFLREGLKDDPPNSMAEAMNRSVRRTLTRAGELGAAVSQRRFELAYQPVVKMTDGSLHHHEALVRFEHGASPFEMVRMAEEFDLIEELDRAVAEQAIRQLKGDRTGELRVAVNMSGRSIGSGPFVEGLQRLLVREARVTPRLIVEITESAAIDDLGQANRHIQVLREMGCLVCLDDFGAGAASLAYLQQLTVDIVKIDGRYVRDLAAGGRDAALVRHLVKLCKDLDMRTVAEMVETAAVEAAVREAGVDLGQGWLYGRPADVPQAPLERPAAAARRTGTSETWA